MIACPMSEFIDSANQIDGIAQVAPTELRWLEHISNYRYGGYWLGKAWG